MHTCQYCLDGKHDHHQFKHTSSGDVTLQFVNGHAWIMPDMILHYIKDHGWMPPIEFIEDINDMPLANAFRFQTRGNSVTRVGYLEGPADKHEFRMGSVPDHIIDHLEEYMAETGINCRIKEV